MKYQTTRDLKNEREIIKSVASPGTEFQWFSRDGGLSRSDCLITIPDGRVYLVEAKDRYGTKKKPYDVGFFERRGMILSTEKVGSGLELARTIPSPTAHHSVDEADAYHAKALFLFRTRELRVFGISMLDIVEHGEIIAFRRLKGEDHRDDLEEEVWKFPLSACLEMTPKRKVRH